MLDNLKCINYEGILSDNEFLETLKVSPGTTTNVDKRVEVVKKYVDYR